MEENSRDKGFQIPSGKGNSPGNVNEHGHIKIHENVITAIVRRATCSVKGVSRLAGSSFIDNLAEIVGSRKVHDRAIGLKMDGANIEVEVKVNMLFGTNIPAVAAEIQSEVTKNIQKITGMNVNSVNVVVQEIEEPPEDKEMPEAPNRENGAVED